MQTSYFGYFGHAWLNTSRMIVSNCRRLLCLSACQKYTSSLTSFLRYYILKNPAFDWWIAFWLPITGETEFCQMRDWWWNINKILVYILDYFQEKLTTKLFKKSKKPILGPFGAFFCLNLGKNNFFWKNGLCHFLDIPITYRPKTRKNYRAICEKNTELTDDRQTTVILWNPP